MALFYASDITDTTKGILIPRLTIAQRNNIQNPSEGLMIYQTDSTKCYWYWDGNTWQNNISNASLIFRYKLKQLYIKNYLTMSMKNKIYLSQSKFFYLGKNILFKLF